ncbi:MAG: 2-dehydro-3-deoxygalactonokinase [Bacillota bacterium]
MGYITIDTGTTNTRIKYIENNRILGTYQEKVGVRDTAITGSLENLKKSIKTGIHHCLNDAHRKVNDIEKIIAFGMITSNLGLIEIPHIEAPVGIKELNESVVIKRFEEIVDQPIYFIPGVKNQVESTSPMDFQLMDMMRGEETESIGVISLMETKGNVIYISPGSHTKFVFFNDERSIMKCSTTLTGELLWALASETILASSIPKNLLSTIEEQYIREGIKAVEKYGFSKTCFLVRIMELFANTTPNQQVNFIAGAIGYHDIKSIEEDLKGNKPTIVIGGKKIMRELYHTIFQLIAYDMSKVIIPDDQILERASSLGALTIVEGIVV